MEYRGVESEIKPVICREKFSSLVWVREKAERDRQTDTDADRQTDGHNETEK